MFTGIITDLGEVRAVEKRVETRFVIGTNFDTGTIALGASIACSGVCLTVVEKGQDWFAVEVSAETLRCTSLADWKAGTRVNLERSLRVGDELGGHIVTGHVDGVGKLVERRPEGGSTRLVFELPVALARFVAPKGSIAVDGVSLTVNEVDGCRFGVNIIPHTQKMTTFGIRTTGDRVNIEVDVLARYVARLGETGST